MFEEHAERAPDRTAVVADDGTLSYGELNARANRLAWRLRDVGVGPDTLVGICVERSAEMIVGLLGILKAGGAYVPIDPGYPAERLDFMLRDSAVPVLVTQRRLVDRLPPHQAALALLDDDEDPARPAGNPPAVGRPDLANVIYTSGSTGTPKGVLVPHRSVLNLVTDQGYVSIGPQDRVAALATLSFDASTFEIWGPLLNGATCVVYSFGGVDPSALCRRVREDAVSVLHLTSPVFRLLEPAHFADLSGVHTLLFGGDSVRADVADLAKKSFGGRLVHLYGPTETTGFATHQDVRAMAPDATMIPIGRPIDRVRIRVLGPDGEDVPDGGTGELYIGGAGMTRGYLDRAELTAQRFVPDPHGDTDGPLYRTGDLVRRGPDGALRFLGRADRQIKVRGHRIEPGEIEAVLTRHPLVNDAVVVARDDGAGDKRLDAYVVRSSASTGPGTEGGPESVAGLTTELRRRIATALPPYQHPASITVIPAIPLTTNLKLDPARLPAPAEERGDASNPATAPRDALEAQLAELWREMLGVAEVGIDDDFFTLGGDSISAVRVATAATRASGVRITVRDVLGSPTIRRLSQLASRATRPPGGAPEPSPTGSPA
nr:non-ribosomal peptide synthetase [Streptomyces sp. CBMA123]